MTDEPVGQEHGADFAGFGEQVIAGGEMQNLRAKPANSAFFNGNENLMLADELPELKARGFRLVRASSVVN